MRHEFRRKSLLIVATNGYSAEDQPGWMRQSLSACTVQHHGHASADRLTELSASGFHQPTRSAPIARQLTTLLPPVARQANACLDLRGATRSTAQSSVAGCAPWPEPGSFEFQAHVPTPGATVETTHISGPGYCMHSPASLTPFAGPLAPLPRRLGCLCLSRRRRGYGQSYCRTVNGRTSTWTCKTRRAIRHFMQSATPRKFELGANPARIVADCLSRLCKWYGLSRLRE